MGELPHLKALVERHKDDPFAIVGVNTDRDKDAFRARCEEEGVTWTNAWQGSTSGPIPTAWGVTGYPTMYVLDGEGVIRALSPRGAELERVVGELVAEAKGEAPVAAVAAVPAVPAAEADPEGRPAVIPAMPLMRPASALAPAEEEHEDFATLEAEWNRAFQTWQTERLKRAQAGEALDMTDPGPVEAFLPRFRALADRGVGLALMWELTQVLRPAGESERRTEVIESLLRDHLDEPWMAGFCAATGYDPRLTRRAIDGSSNPRVRSTNLHTLAEARWRAVAYPGRPLEEAERATLLAEARALMKEWLERYGDQPGAERLRGILFQIEHLQVGMTAPDWEAQTVDGDRFKLSDYRGKVTVLDFWGFW